MIDILLIQREDEEDYYDDFKELKDMGYLPFGPPCVEMAYVNKVVGHEENGNPIYESKVKYYEQDMILFYGQKVIKDDNWQNGCVEIHDLLSDNKSIKELHYFSNSEFEKSMIFKKEYEFFILFKTIKYTKSKIFIVCEGTFDFQNFDSQDKYEYVKKEINLLDGVETHFQINNKQDYWDMSHNNEILQKFTLKNGIRF